MDPHDFADVLVTKTFTNGADRAFVAGKYAGTFIKIMGGIKTLSFNELALARASAQRPMCARIVGARTPPTRASWSAVMAERVAGPLRLSVCACPTSCLSYSAAGAGARVSRTQ